MHSKVDSLASIFKEMDKDGNGLIDVAEWTSALTQLGLDIPGASSHTGVHTHEHTHTQTHTHTNTHAHTHTHTHTHTRTPVGKTKITHKRRHTHEHA